MKTFTQFLNENFNVDKSIKYKKEFEGEFVRFNATDSTGELLGSFFVRLKKKWNQFHIEVAENQRNKGLSYQFIFKAISEYNHISIPSGRVVNPIIFKIIEKIKKENYFSVYLIEETNEYLIWDAKKVTIKELEIIFGFKKK